MKKILSFVLSISFLLSLFACNGMYAQRESNTVLNDTAEASLLGDNTKGVIFSFGKDGQSFNFTWEAASSSAEYLQYAVNSSRTDDTMPSGSKQVAASVVSSSRGYTARASVKNLIEGTEYCYRVGSDSAGWSDIYTFKTSDLDGAFSFLLSGDPQIGATANQFDTDNWNTSLNNAREWFGDEIEFLMTAGDQVNTNTTHNQYEGFMSNPWLRSIPTVTTVGNHDDGAPYSDYYTYSDVDSATVTYGGSQGGDYWFAYDCALIMSLNFNNYSIAAHKDFMQKTIKNYTDYYGEPTWIIAVFHQPIYSQGTRAEYEFTIAQRNELAPVLSELGVDVVLTGHDHVYTRAYMMNGINVKDDASLYTPVNGDPYGSYYYPDDGDVFYLTANSGSGSKYYNLNANVMPFTCVSSKEHTPTLTKIDVTWDSITFTTHRVTDENTADDILDFFAIHKETDGDFYAPALKLPAETYFDTVEGFDPMDGVSAYDNVEGDVTDMITYEGEIDLSKEFTLTYTASDSSGNSIEKTRRFIPYTYTESINGDTFWSYIDDGSTPYNGSDLTSWATSSFDDSQWKTAISPFGANGGKLGKHNTHRAKTLLNQYYPADHESAGDNIPHFFFRYEFDLNSPELVSMIKGKLRYDDACNVFINGVQVDAFNSAKVSNGAGYCSNTSASAADLAEFTLKDKAFIESLGLKESGNVLAVAVYQSNATSSDVFFLFESLKFARCAPEHYAYSEEISENVSFDFLDDGTTPYNGGDITSWATDNFDSSSWKSGSSPFGSLSGSLGSHNGVSAKTLLNYSYPSGHENAGKTIPNYFFRHEFDLEDPELVRVLHGSFMFDDACAVFVNGVQVESYNTAKIVNGAGYSSYLASFNGDEGEFTVSGELLEACGLKEKGNVLAFIVSQGDSGSSDVFFKFNGMKIAQCDPTPSLSANGVTLTLDGIRGVNDIFIAKGTHTTYRQVKDNLVVQLTQNKLMGANSYTYILSKPGDYTVYIRYPDAAKDAVILYTTLTVTEPEFSTNGLQVTIKNLEGIKVLRTAYGEYDTPGEVKRAEGQRSFSKKYIPSDEYMIQYRSNGMVTVAVCYENGYNVIYHYDIVKKSPVVEQNGNTVTFSGLDGLKVIRYAMGEYDSSSAIKNAEGSVALTPKKIVDGKISVSLKQGIYTFCVQYDDESYNYYTLTF
ncbi:MAG: DUF5011 domain-containing protein [Ruminococcaceae bacterium]|nr:DUF5011 domain-containing protein [Oscillospiraceae bacterium]